LNTRSRGAHARVTARARAFSLSSYVTMAAREDGSVPEHSDTIVTTEEGTDGGEKPVDPRNPTSGDPTLTKAALKRFEFVPRGDLSSYQIPKKVPRGADAEDVHSLHSESEEATLRARDKRRAEEHKDRERYKMNLPLPNWGAPDYSGPSTSAQDYWNASWAPDAYWDPNYYQGASHYDYYDHSYEEAEEGQEEFPTSAKSQTPGPLSKSDTSQPQAAAACDVSPDPVSSKTKDALEEDPDNSENPEEMLAQPEWDLTALKQQMLEFGSDAGPAVHTTLTSHLNAVWQKGSANKMKELHEKHPLPAGCHMFRAALNDSIASFMQSSEKMKYPYTRDVKLTGIQGLIARAAIPLAKTCEGVMRKDKSLSAPQHMELAMDAFTLLASASQQVNQLRKALIKPSMNAKLRASMCRPVKDEEPSEWLFPDLVESAKIAKQTSGLMAFSGFRGRPRGRGRYQPYFGPPQGYGRGFPPRGNFYPPRGEYVPLDQCDTLLSISTAPWELPLLHFDAYVEHPVVSSTYESDDIFCSRWTPTIPPRKRSPSRERVREDPTPVPEVSIAHIPPIYDKWGAFKAGRTKQCLASWRQHTSDPWLLKNLHGYKL
jgi:hypothetical protein